jgi:hypothetical protein
MSYMSVVPDTKSDRMRYIRVAEIVIVITEGSWNICVVDRYVRPIYAL